MTDDRVRSLDITSTTETSILAEETRTGGCDAVVRSRTAGVLVTVLAIACASLYDIEARQPESIDLSVVSGRPLADAIRELEDRFGWVITYEDPPYE